FEDLVPGARGDRERHGRRHFHGREVDRQRREPEVGPTEWVSGGDGHVVRLVTIAEVAHLELTRAGGKVGKHEARGRGRDGGWEAGHSGKRRRSGLILLVQAEDGIRDLRRDDRPTDAVARANAEHRRTTARYGCNE